MTPDQDNTRARRVADQIHKELAEMLSRKISDPRLHGVTVSGVDVSRDLRYAKVYVITHQHEETAPLMAALKHARGFLRRGLSKRLSIRSLPELRFVYDQTLDQAHHISALIDQAIAADRRSNNPQEDDD